MMFHWEPDMIRFMRDASDYCTYNKELAALMAPFLNKTDRICDAGCGLGYLSLELAPLVGDVTAVDINGGALDVLRENCTRRGIVNIKPVCGNIAENPPERRYNSMAFCFFGKIGQIIELAGTQCDGDIFVFQRNYENHRFTVGTVRNPDGGADSVTAELEARGIPYDRTDIAPEFGQPFKSIDDARRFFEIYSRDDDKSVITDEFVASRLTETGREDFPFYMPHRRRVSFIHFKTADIDVEERK